MRILVFLLAAFTWARAIPREQWLSYGTELPNREVTSIHIDAPGNRYFGTNRGLAILSTSDDWKTWTVANSAGGLGGDSITCMVEDRQGNIWIGTRGGGVSRYFQEQWQNFNRDNTGGGLPDDRILSAAVDERGDLWFGTSAGFARLSAGNWTPWNQDRIAGLVADPAILAIAATDDREVWLGTAVGLYRYDGASYKGFTREGTAGGLPSNYITAIARGVQGDLWVGTQNGLSRRRAGKKMPFGQDSSGLPGEVVYDLCVSKDGRVWAAFLGGAAVYDRNVWKVFTRSNTAAGLLSRRVTAIRPSEGQREVWFGTREGLSRLIYLGN